MVSDHTGRVAIVTGASAGIGRAIAELLAQRGASVVVADLDGPGAEAVAQSITDNGGAAIAIPVDVADVASIRALVDRAVAWRGRLDILVNNAGIAIGERISDYTLEQWNRQLAVNLTGSFFALQAVLPAMRSIGGGCIVNIASTSAFVSSTTPVLAYDVSKAGVRQLTVSAAAELAAENIRVNAVAPGTVATSLTTALLDTDEKLDTASAKIPAGRLGEPRDIAGAVSWLVSDDSAYVHGHTLVVDGGWLLR